jgi:hypothetical protein
VDHALKATFWWKWDNGSAPFFWRWPEEYIRDVSLDIAPMWIATPNRVITPQAGLGNPNQILLIRDKIDDIQYKGYIESGPCAATMNYFPVKKGEVDVRMVYDGTKSGLNNCLHALWFPLPDMNNLLRTLDDGYFCIDNDYGEMF